DHHVLRGPDKTAGADIGELRIGSAVGVVDFNNAYSGALVLAGEDGGISRGLQGDRNSRFLWIAGGEREIRQLRGLRRIILPIVVRQYQRAVARPKLEGGIGQEASNAEGGEGRPESSDRHAFGGVPVDDEPRDEDVIAGID